MKETFQADTEKTVALGVLYIFAVLIAVLGAGFAVYSITTGLTLRVLTSDVPGAVFGGVIAFLGIRYFLAVRKLSVRVRDSGPFSWSNFHKTSGRLSKSKDGVKQ